MTIPPRGLLKPWSRSAMVKTIRPIAVTIALGAPLRFSNFRRPNAVPSASFPLP